MPAFQTTLMKSKSLTVKAWTLLLFFFKLPQFFSNVQSRFRTTLSFFLLHIYEYVCIYYRDMDRFTKNPLRKGGWL